MAKVLIVEGGFGCVVVAESLAKSSDETRDNPHVEKPVKYSGSWRVFRIG